METESPRAVFISYARDDIAAAQRIADALHNHGVEVWFDLNELRGGDAWDQKIRKQIKSCMLFIPIISGRTQERSEGYFRLEWRLAVERSHLMAEGFPFLAPLVVDDTLESNSVVPAEFMRVQWSRLPGGLPTPDYIELVRNLLFGSSKPVQPRAAPTYESRKTDPKSVAVLAFANLSNDPENEFFSDGVSEELLNMVARIPGLRVAARTSAFYFKGKNVPIPEIARALGVSNIIEGSVRRAGSRVRISAKLISASDGLHIWSDTFDRELKDIFAVQDEIAGLIAQNLQLKLGQAPRPAKEVNPEAYRLVLEGRHHWSLRSDIGFELAEKAFLRALEISPDFAQAHAGLADVYAVRTVFGGMALGVIRGGDMNRVKERAETALLLDPALGEAHGGLAMYYFSIRDFAAAERHFREMLALNPNYAFGHLWSAHMMLARGRIDEALKACDRSIALDPLSFPSWAFRGMVLNLCHRYADALSSNEEAAKLGGGAFLGYHSIKCFALLAIGRIADARESAREILTKQGEFSGRWLVDDSIYVLRQAGVDGEAYNAALKISAGLLADSCYHGFALQAAGRFHEALPFLGTVPAFTQARLYFHPIWDPVRDDPRFHHLLEAIGCGKEYAVGRETLARMLKEA